VHPLRLQALCQFIGRQMPFGRKKHFQNFEAILEIFDLLPLEKLFELLFFLGVNLTHRATAPKADSA